MCRSCSEEKGGGLVDLEGKTIASNSQSEGAFLQ